MSLKIGVSGVRGIVGESLTAEVIGDFAKAFGTFVLVSGLAGKRVSGLITRTPAHPHTRTPKILVGRDTRTSGEFVRKTVVDGLLATGCKVADLGLAPTPTVLFAARTFKAAGAIIITASHNPASWNGLKFVRPDGTFLTKTEIEKLIEIYKNKKFHLPANERVTSHQLPVTSKDGNAIKAHLNTVLGAVDVKAIASANFKVAIDYVNGTGAVASGYLLKRLGCEVFAVNASPDGRFSHNPEPIAENLKQLVDLVKKTKADIGFAQDPDADRLAIVSEKGVAIGEENTLALAVKHVLAKHTGDTLRPDNNFSRQGVPAKLRVVVNLSTSKMIDDIAGEFGAKVYRSAVGETNVVALMRKQRALVGGEGNGGVIYPAVNFGRDSFIGMAIILEYMANSKKTVSQLLSSIKQYHIEKTKIEYAPQRISGALEVLKQRYKNEKVSTLDGVKIEWSDGWVHVRGSNTEPVIRIMAEAHDAQTVRKYIEDIKGQILC